MKKRNYELIALIVGVVINFVQGIGGVVFYFITDSMSIFLDAIISVILCFTSVGSILLSRYVNKKNNDDFPFGRKAIENLFLLFRSVLMLATIVLTIVDGTKVIVAFAKGIITSDFNADNWTLIIYCLFMSGLCVVLMLVYNYCYKKSQPKSEIVRIEIKASLYDGLVTFFAISSLLIFNNVKFLAPLSPIGDSITVIILSIIYAYSPIVEIVNQIKILIDKRRNGKLEKKMMIDLQDLYPEFKFNDIYFACLGTSYQIFISLFPSTELSVDEMEEKFNEIRKLLRGEYKNSKILIMMSKKMIHQM